MQVFLCGGKPKSRLSLRLGRLGSLGTDCAWLSVCRFRVRILALTLLTIFGGVLAFILPRISVTFTLNRRLGRRFSFWTVLWCCFLLRFSIFRLFFFLLYCSIFLDLFFLLLFFFDFFFLCFLLFRLGLNFVLSFSSISSICLGSLRSFLRFFISRGFLSLTSSAARHLSFAFFSLYCLFVTYTLDFLCIFAIYLSHFSSLCRLLGVLHHESRLTSHDGHSIDEHFIFTE
mmetsp:Transcript_1118/g.1669  ORF Transcript_1118/g.1669 Transcript_1118/m.1669 type:complete len:230 (-) Transcript_1118:155-844(-)